MVGGYSGVRCRVVRAAVRSAEGEVRVVDRCFVVGVRAHWV